MNNNKTLHNVAHASGDDVPEVDFDDLQAAFDRQRQRIEALLAAVDAAQQGAAGAARSQYEPRGRKGARRQATALRGCWTVAVLSLAAAVAWGCVLDRYSQGVALRVEVLAIEALLVVLFAAAVAAVASMAGQESALVSLSAAERLVRRRRRGALMRHNLTAVSAATVLALTIVACAPAPERCRAHYDDADIASLEQIIRSI